MEAILDSEVCSRSFNNLVVLGIVCAKENLVEYGEADERDNLLMKQRPAVTH